METWLAAAFVVIAIVFIVLIGYGVTKVVRRTRDMAHFGASVVQSIREGSPLARRWLDGPYSLPLYYSYRPPSYAYPARASMNPTIFGDQNEYGGVFGASTIGGGIVVPERFHDSGRRIMVLGGNFIPLMPIPQEYWNRLGTGNAPGHL
ncbi:hypothetical protein C8J56DRAFT_1156595 [Mycena floridula]|nr:hypothetical protein C8J56DRAFT_1156595 [Mycena floridula]